VTPSRFKITWRRRDISETKLPVYSIEVITINLSVFASLEKTAPLRLFNLAVANISMNSACLEK
jgi:hypothetical protein